jgi:large subunit ribosomal protein L32e
MAKRSPKKLSKSLKIREKISSERPPFKRSETHRFPRLGDKWRSSKGIRSKMRLKKMGRAAIVETGYRGPVLTRGLHPTGKREVIVYRVEDLTAVNPDLDVVRIAGTVGTRKRLEVLQKAKELELQVINRRPSEKEEKREEAKEKEKEKKEKGAPKEAEKEAEVKEEGEWSAEKEEAQIEEEEERR